MVNFQDDGNYQATYIEYPRQRSRGREFSGNIDISFNNVGDAAGGVSSRYISEDQCIRGSRKLLVLVRKGACDAQAGGRRVIEEVR